MTSDESARVPANKDNGFMRKSIVNLENKFTRHIQYNCRHLTRKAKTKHYLHHIKGGYITL